MPQFSIGILSFEGAVLLPLAYLIGRQIRRFGAWIQRENGPKERAGSIVVILAIVGFVIGSFGQTQWNKGVVCQA
jgi:hypothetical protein